MNFSKPFFLFLFLSILIFSSCSSDDDTSSNDIPVDNPEEAIIGQWNLTARTEDGLEFCELSHKFYFNEDNTLEFDYNEGDEPGDCYNLLIMGSYEFLDENQLKLTFESPIESTQNVTYEFSNSSTLLISFFEDSTVTETYKKQ